MKFESRPLSGNVNVAPCNPLKDFLDLGLRIFGCVILLYVLLGWAAEILAVRIPPAFEDKLARALTFEFNKIPPTALEAYATGLTNKLASLTEDLKGRNFVVHIMPEKEANALAWPGGNIVLTSGLFEAVHSENDLAMVLGHELGHYAHRDHLRGLGRGLVLLAISVTVFGADTRSGSLFANLVSDSEMHNSREREAAADAYGLQVLFKSYGHVGGADAFFNYAKTKEEKMPAWIHFLSTHPSSQKRLAALKTIAANRHWPTAPVQPFPPTLSKNIEDIRKPLKKR